VTTPRLVLGIESSCDETAAAVVRDGRVVLSNVIASQHDLHAQYQGVVPEIASRAHAERVLPVVEAALADAGVGLNDLSAVAVGNRPGLIGSLLVGVAAAKALAWSLGVPLIGVDHIHAHLYAGFMDAPSPSGQPADQETHSHGVGFGAARAPDLPALGLVVSGGHTALYEVLAADHVVRLGATIDDAVGEAYDKAASILRLPFPGGPAVDKLAQRGNPRAVDLPRSTLGRDSLDFSFSGLKTALRYAAFGVPERGQSPPAAPTEPLPEGRLADLCASFQAAAVGVLLLKVERALQRHPHLRTLLVGGGVSANSALRAALGGLRSPAKGRPAIDVRLPPMGLCLDNAAMIAGLGGVLLGVRPEGDPLWLTGAPSSTDAAARVPVRR
jgi:N6-L-threonylcarbamoyladenine synthase